MRWRSALLVISLAPFGCRLESAGLATIDDLTDGAVDSTASSDGSAIEDTSPLFPLEDATPGTCEGSADGTPCGALAICVAMVCLPARCGDTFVSAGEDCDDGNETDGDSCPGDCKFKCTTDTQCDDGNTCSIDKCDLGMHVCAPKTAVDKGTACEISPGVAGVCNGTSCTPAACGNGKQELTEECDDGNTNDADGCKSDCTFTCKVAADCDDKNACNGAEKCDPSHKCLAGTPKACGDGVACTADRCNASTGMCVNTLIDLDGDGFAAKALGGCGKDCHDGNPIVKPGQMNWFVPSYGLPSGARSWDYDCDGAQTKRFTAIGGCSGSGSSCTYTKGWSGAVPACGSGEFWVTGCENGNCRPILSDTKYAQECR